jgi:hypothetical protein
MKLGSKKTKQAELLDALGEDVLASPGTAEAPASVATTAPEPAPVIQKVTGRGSLPEVEEKGYVALSSVIFSVHAINSLIEYTSSSRNLFPSHCFVMVVCRTWK